MERRLSKRGTQQVNHTDVDFDPSPSAVALRADLVAQAWEACGITAAMRSGSSGQGRRAAFSEWTDSWLRPFAAVVSEQMAHALEVNVDLDVTTSKVPAVEDQARIVAMLAKAGVPVEEAKGIAGLS